MFARLVLLSLAVLAVVLAPACGQQSPSAPSSRTSSTVSAAPPTSSSRGPALTEDFSALLGVWNATIRVTEVKGSGCVVDAMRAQPPQPYTLLITRKDSFANVTLKSETANRACTFTPVADNSGFTTYGVKGTYTCEPWPLTLTCSDGTQHSISTFGEDISGQLSSSNQMTGSWDAYWLVDIYNGGFEMRAQLTASR